MRYKNKYKRGAYVSVLRQRETCVDTHLLHLTPMGDLEGTDTAAILDRDVDRERKRQKAYCTDKRGHRGSEASREEQPHLKNIT